MREPDPTFLASLLGEILQDAAFVLAEPGGAPVVDEPPVVVARIDFEATRGGTIRLAAGAGAAAEIAGNMLGLDAGDREAAAQGPAAVGEVLNVIGGAFVTRFFGTSVPSQLGLPFVDVVPAWAAERPARAVAVRTDGGHPIVLELDLEGAG